MVGTRQQASMLFVTLLRIRGVATAGKGVRSPLMRAPDATLILRLLSVARLHHQPHTSTAPGGVVAGNSLRCCRHRAPPVRAARAKNIHSSDATASGCTPAAAKDLRHRRQFVVYVGRPIPSALWVTRKEQALTLVEGQLTFGTKNQSLLFTLRHRPCSTMKHPC
ncbi:hypothetical protein NDU88_004669 [Pleurodeles waltl]|uniref:Secreted protein n=1 Tax=Pleurodeles waltl TaxID=8319 RepID=A0AAV7RIX3_PLEWA|nr:hypothetical protein NDU88_004669 [Pleurodeles waltl]